MDGSDILEFLVECPECAASYLIDIPVEDAQLLLEQQRGGAQEGGGAALDCEDCGQEIDAVPFIRSALEKAKG